MPYSCPLKQSVFRKIKISQEDSLHAILLPIKTVGVQVNKD